MNEISLRNKEAERKQVSSEEREQLAVQIGFRKDSIADFQTELASLLKSWPDLD